MSKIVIELQQEALKSDFDILNLLRKAYLVARKLKLNEFEKWIDSELNGYKNLYKIPDYRLLRGEVKAWNPYHGWIPVIFEDDIESITTHSASDTISSLLNVYENSENRTAILPFNASMNNYLSKHGGFHTKYALMIGTNQIYNIIERVRNIILDWSITLEENGILGEGLQFSNTEKEIANNTPVINHYINNFWGDVSSTQIQQDTKESIQEQ